MSNFFMHPAQAEHESMEVAGQLASVDEGQFNGSYKPALPI